jgi:hypothetical protein
MNEEDHSHPMDYETSTGQAGSNNGPKEQEKDTDTNLGDKAADLSLKHPFVEEEHVNNHLNTPSMNKCKDSPLQQTSGFEDQEEDAYGRSFNMRKEEQIESPGPKIQSSFESEIFHPQASLPFPQVNKPLVPASIDSGLETSSQSGKSLTEILIEAIRAKDCSEHHQSIITICTDFGCPKRFWCGVCCVKSKDLYVRFSTHMTLISDFLEENIAKLYDVKTFTEENKKEIVTKLEDIAAKNEETFEQTWNLIDRDIEEYKKELISRIDNQKLAVKERYKKSVKTISNFYEELKARIKMSQTRDIGQELEMLKSEIISSRKDPLKAIEDIGNKVNVDIYEVEKMNADFDKSREFIEFTHKCYEIVRQSTIPKYVSMNKSIPALADKVESISAASIKSLLDDSQKELEAFQMYYEGLLLDHETRRERERLMHLYLNDRPESDQQFSLPASSKDVEESMVQRPKPSYADRRMQGTLKDGLGKTPSSGKERAVDHTMSLRDQRSNLASNKNQVGKF